MPYTQGVYTAQIMNTVLDHSMKQNPANNFWQYGDISTGGGDGKIIAFNGESVNGKPMGSDPSTIVCIGGTLHIPTTPNVPTTDLVRHPGGCGDVNFSSYDEHPGYDYHAALKTPVYAAAGGIVVKNFHVTNADGSPKMCVDTNVKGTCTAKNYVGIDHGTRGLGGYISQYGHLSVILVNPGDPITQGQLIGYSGDVGAPGNPHLHFEVIKLMAGLPNNYNAYNYAVVDPYGWVGGTNALYPQGDPLYSSLYLGIPSVQLWQ
jgi:Peptidase family M23